jgi:hypothetical protein
MSRSMMLVIAISAFSGLIVSMMIVGEETPAHRPVSETAGPPLDASNAMAEALRKAIEGDKR